MASYFTFLQSASDSNWTRVPLVADFALGFASIDTATNTATSLATSSTNYIGVNASGNIIMNTIDSNSNSGTILLFASDKISYWNPSSIPSKHILSLDASKKALMNEITSVTSLSNKRLLLTSNETSANTYYYFTGSTSSTKLLFFSTGGFLGTYGTPIGSATRPVYYSTNGFIPCDRALIDVQYASGILTITK